MMVPTIKGGPAPVCDAGCRLAQHNSGLDDYGIRRRHQLRSLHGNCLRSLATSKAASRVVGPEGSIGRTMSETAILSPTNGLSGLRVVKSRLFPSLCTFHDLLEDVET
jgi:hypothetical protein